MYAAIVFLPILGSAIAGLFGRVIGARASELVTTGLLFVSAALSIVAFNDVALEGHKYIIQILPWIHSGDFAVDWTVRVDTITAVMLVVVTGVSSLVHLYSIGYMQEDPHRPRFFSYLSLFTFAMLMLVTANNFLQLFFGWEGVGLASYLLIGFWYTRPVRQCRRDQGLCRQPRGRFRLRAGHLRRLCVFKTLDFDAVFQAAPGTGRQAVHLRRPQRRYPHHPLPAAVRGRDGQVGAVGPAHLAARRDGRPDAGLRPDPCRHHGDGGRVPGLPLLAPVPAGARARWNSSPSSAPPRPSSPPRSACSRTTSSG